MGPAAEEEEPDDRAAGGVKEVCQRLEAVPMKRHDLDRS